MFTTLFRIGKDAALRSMPNGDAVLEMSLAYNYGKKDSDGKRPTQWIKATIFGKRAESVAPYIKKGGQVVATLDEVHIQQREYQGKTYTDLCARVVDVKLCGGKQESADHGGKPATASKSSPSAQQSADVQFDEDEIPF